MHFDLVDMRLFISIAESPSLTRGANKVFLSPAAASMRIKALETQLNTKLLFRDNKGVELTETGKKLLVHARILVRQAENLRNDFSETGSGLTGQLRIFANTTAITEFLPEVLATYLVERPGITVDLQMRQSKEIVRGVLEGAADFGIVAGPVVTSNLQTIAFSTDQLVVIIPCEHFLQNREKIKFSEVLDFQNIGFNVGSTLHSFITEQAEELGRHIHWRVQLSSFESICRMVEAGIGVSVIPESVALKISQRMNLDIISLDEPWALRERKIVMRDVHELPRCAIEIINEVVRFFAMPAQ